MVVTSRGNVLWSAHIRVNSNNGSLSRGDSPAVRLRSSHKLEGYLLATSVAKLVKSCSNAYKGRTIKERQDLSSLRNQFRSQGPPQHLRRLRLPISLDHRHWVNRIKDSRASLRDDISSWIARNSRTVGIATRYLYRTRYLPCV